MSKVNVHRVAGELAAISNELLAKIRESRKNAQSYVTRLRDVEEDIRTILREEQERRRLQREFEEARQTVQQSEPALKAPVEIPTAPAADQKQYEAVAQEISTSSSVISSPVEQETEVLTSQHPTAPAFTLKKPRNEGAQRTQGGFTPREESQGRLLKARNGQQRPTYTPREGQQRPYTSRNGQRQPFSKDRIPDKDSDRTTYRPVARSVSRPKTDALPALEKDRTVFDTRRIGTKKDAARNTNVSNRTKNKKAIMKEQAPTFRIDDDVIRGRRKRKGSRSSKSDYIVIDHAVITTERVTIKTLAEKIGKPGAEIIKKLMQLGIMATINQEIDYDTAELIAADFGVALEQQVEKTAAETMVFNYDEMTDESQFVERPPVVTVMGHVDHGKTSLLDRIRKTRVTAGEAGGITQHIGAYSIATKTGRRITFLDTPGHEAFTAMRARGAQVTDVAILVVAVNDGIMPQTVEAINHIKAANVPMIVAINKMDLPNADANRVMQELTQYSIVPEEWGGDTVIAKVSATVGTGVDDLLDMILLVSDVQELKADPNRLAKGTVVEAKMDNRGRGPVATVLVQNGTLHTGDYVVAGGVSGRVRFMTDDMGSRVEEAGPSIPVEVVGFSDVPEAGDEFYAVDDEKFARRVAEERREKIKVEQMKMSSRVSLDDLFERISQGNMKELRLIVKADVQGSAEAVKQSLEKLSNDEIRVTCIHTSVGAITENDIMLASASNAIIIGFNIRPDAMARAAADREKVDVRLYRIIYSAIEDVEKAMRGMLAPTFKEVLLGHAEVRNIFTISSVGTVAGCYVIDGKMQRNSSVRLLRDNVVIFEGKMASLKRFKDDVREVPSGYECGITLDGYNDIKERDVIEAYTMEQNIIE